MTDLAYRINTGAALSPLWERRNQISTAGESKSRRKRSYRPFAFARAHRNETLDRIAARGPLF